MNFEPSLANMFRHVYVNLPSNSFAWKLWRIANHSVEAWDLIGQGGGFSDGFKQPANSAIFEGHDPRLCPAPLVNLLHRPGEECPI